MVLRHLAARHCALSKRGHTTCNELRLPHAGVQIVFYFLFGNVQIAFCFLLSCFFTKQRTATIVAYLWVFGSGLVARQLLENLFIHERWFTILIELIPTFAAFRCGPLSPVMCSAGECSQVQSLIRQSFQSLAYKQPSIAMLRASTTF